jgi:endonuclease/exonuclease/phosphatase family metal-dependent hydrolase
VTSLRVLTLNIWNCQGPWRKRLRLIRRELEALAPDLVGLQEVMCHDATQTDQARDIAAGLGYHMAYGPASQLGDGPQFGNAVLSRFPILAQHIVPLPGKATEESRAVLHVAVDAPGGRLAFFATHLDWKPEHGDVRVGQVAAILDAVNALAPGAEVPAVLVGDFNAGPETEEVRLVCAPCEDRVPFADCFAAAGDGSPGHTFARSNRYAAKGCERSQRIDYVFSRPDRVGRGEPLLARVVCTTPAGGVFASDHYGVYAEIR